MPVNPELVGRDFAPTARYLVGREKVREFARAVFATDPQHTDPAAAQALGYADVVAPPTFAMVVQDLTLQQLLSEPDSGIVLQNVLHAEQRFRYLREYGMRPFTNATLTTTEAFEADLAAGDRRGMQLELGQFRQGVACAAVLVTPDKDIERRVVLACALPASEMMTSARVVRAKLLTAARAGS